MVNSSLLRDALRLRRIDVSRLEHARSEDSGGRLSQYMPHVASMTWLHLIQPRAGSPHP
jgi:hypothetical protein